MPREGCERKSFCRTLSGVEVRQKIEVGQPDPATAGARPNNKISIFNILKTIVYIFILSLITLNLKAQSFKIDTMLLKGKYFGKNLYAQNPRLVKGNDTIYTAQQVLVNDSLVLNSMQLHISAFAIPLTKLHLKEGDNIVVKIVQWNFDRVKILNEMNCYPKSKK